MFGGAAGRIAIVASAWSFDADMVMVPGSTVSLAVS